MSSYQISQYTKPSDEESAVDVSFIREQDSDISLKSPANTYYALSSSKRKRWTYFSLLFILMLFLVIMIIQFVWGTVTTYLYFNDRRPNVDMDPNHLHIFCFNDVYELKPSGDQELGGVSRASRYIKDHRQVVKNSMVLFAGDMISPSVDSTLYFGKQMIEANNLLGLEYACLGNHEFDFGLDTLEERIKESNFLWLNANLKKHDDITKPVVPKVLNNHIKDIGGHRIGIFGLSYDVRDTVKNGTALMTYIDYVTTANQQITTLKQMGADFIIALTHMNADDDCKLSKVSGIDLIIGGHDHLMQTTYSCGPTPYVKATSDYHNIWHLMINFNLDGKKKKPVIQFKNVPITKDMETDALVEELIEKYDKEREEKFGKVVAKTNTLIDTLSQNLRTRETSGGNLVADSLRNIMKTDIAIVNGGGIRANREFPANSDVTLGNVVEMLPFANLATTMKVNKTVLTICMESGVSHVDELRGGYPQISGFKFSYSTEKKVGERVLSLTYPNGDPIPDDIEMTLTTSDFISEGGDGYEILSHLPRTYHNDLISTVLLNYLQNQKVVSPVIEGRSVRVV